MAKEFTTTGRPRQVIEFDLDGEHYTFTAPKRAGLIMSVVATVGIDGKGSTESDSVRDLLNWVGEGLPDDQGERLMARLQDPEDDFDLENINEIARYLLGQTSNRPTRRRSA
jgi:hypothetical protein